MVQVFLLVAGLIYSIHGSYVCPPAPPFDPSCIARLIKPGCSSDADCTKPGTKCCKSDCNVLQCVESVQGIVKVGICPPLPNVKPDFCLTAKFSSDCDGNDANCPGQKKCCLTLCGSRNCRDPIAEPRPECPAVPVPGPQCFRFDQQCSSDLDCPKSKICCGVICGTACRDPVVSYLPPPPDALPREGVCPPPEVVSQDFCNRADVRSDCSAVGRDSECRLAGYKCCPGVCGSLLCQAALTDDRPGCPPINPNLVCITYNQQCNTDDDCGKGKQCCYQPSCGTSCSAPDPNCPPYRKDVICKRFDKQCTTNADCKEGHICCSVECGTACKRPYRPPYENPPCQPVLCDLFCEFGFAKDENGCEICRCIQSPCVNGNPLPNIFCGRGPSHQECPSGYSCNVDPADRFAVCCPDSTCPNGNPLPSIFCGRGPSHQDCPPGYSCNIDPADAFAVCCPDRKKYGSCPPIKPGTVGPCVELCSDDDSCPGKEKCCSNGCGHACTNPIGEHTCPLIKCAFCEHGYEMDDYGCQTCKCKPDPCPSPVCPPPPEGSCTENDYKIINGLKCLWCPKIVPCKPKDCPIPDCAQPPPLSCTEPDFRIFEGVKCPWCPKIVPCKANCNAGMPLPDINCGLRPDRQNCPAGFFCNVDPIDRFAVCCPDCDRGKPLPNVRCDDVNRKCPPGYRCKKTHGICCQDCPQIKCSNQCEFGFLNDSNGCPTCDCKPSPCLLPPCARPPPDACTEPQYKIIDGVRCPWCYKIVPCKDKVCPAAPVDHICYEYARDCQDDSSCTDGRKCCRQGCSYVCVNPV